MIEFLAGSSRSRGLTEIARAMDISKARAHRHVRALVQHGYATQDAETARYVIGIKLLALGEAVRVRFDILGATRPEMARLRDETGQTVTISTLIDDAVVVLDLLPGKTLIEFGVRPGSTLDLSASAHGLRSARLRAAASAVGDIERTAPRMDSRDGDRSRQAEVEIDQVRDRGWATASDQLLIGVNALAAPIFDYQNDWRGTIAIVGATQFIAASPSQEQIALVKSAAAAASGRLGWKAKAP